MVEYEMIEKDPELGAWHLIHWDYRQFESDNVSLRTAKHRSKERDRNVLGTTLEQNSLLTETETDTETETETDLKTFAASETESAETENLPVPILNAPKQRQRDLLFEATLEACGIDWKALSQARSKNGKAPSALGGYNRAVSELRAMGATPEQVWKAVEFLNRAWKIGTITPTVLARRWPELPAIALRHQDTQVKKNSPIDPETVRRLAEEERLRELEKGVIEL